MKVCLLSFSHIPTDGRIRRHGDTLIDQGHSVTGVGLEGPAVELPPGWTALDITVPPWRAPEKASQAARLFATRASGRLAPAVYWQSQRHQALYEAARRVEADLFVANDWNTLPIAARLAREYGAAYAYDTHEYAVEERADRRRWRLVWPPFLRALEAKYIRQAVWVSTVSEGIADLLYRDYSLDRRPTVVRNVPAYVEMPHRPAGDAITVLFHGGMQRDRGLEQLIDSVAGWQPDRRLVIRGSGEPAYEADLRERAARAGVSDRVTFEPPVGRGEVVRAANASADIGIHPMPAITRQLRFALPNKFFEYMMAGLAVCVVASSEMSTLVGRYRTGAVIEQSTPVGIAAAVNAFSHEDIDTCKEHSLAAARELSWDCEKDRLISLY